MNWLFWITLVWAVSTPFWFILGAVLGAKGERKR